MASARRPDADDYPSPEARIVDRWPDEKLLAIEPTTERQARKWLGAANQYGTGGVVEHFVELVQSFDGQY